MIPNAPPLAWRTSLWPLLGGVLSGKAGTRAELDRAVQARIADGLVTEIDIWRPDGTVVYANEPAVIGRRFPLSPELRAATRRIWAVTP